ncbi:MAG: RNA-binding protein [Alphaproteobacteria bacterium]
MDGILMPTGPKGQKRPADVVGNAVRVMQIATGEAEEEFADDGKNRAAQELGRKGGKARAKSMSAKRRKEIAKKAAEKRWAKP